MTRTPEQIRSDLLSMAHDSTVAPFFRELAGEAAAEIERLTALCKVGERDSMNLVRVCEAIVERDKAIAEAVRRAKEYVPGEGFEAWNAASDVARPLRAFTTTPATESGEQA